MATRIALAIVVIAFTAAGSWLAHEVLIDQCLDRGGVWDHEQVHCLETAR